MKKIFTISAILILGIFFLAGCSKSGTDYGYDENYWLSKERGEVVYSDSYCPFFVVQTYSGYTIVKASGGFTPYEGSTIYGDLSRRGYRDLYNRSDGTIIRGEITDYWLSYGEAQYLIDNLCY
ncbi:MAG: hypothetical protein ACSLE0_22830 [Chitinophagaceae bacterium]